MQLFVRTISGLGGNVEMSEKYKKVLDSIFLGHFYTDLVYIRVVVIITWSRVFSLFSAGGVCRRSARGAESLRLVQIAC